MESQEKEGLYNTIILELFIGVQVDLVMKDSLKPKIGQKILSEVIYL